jgi:hypothetical protein
MQGIEHEAGDFSRVLGVNAARRQQQGGDECENDAHDGRLFLTMKGERIVMEPEARSA